MLNGTELHPRWGSAYGVYCKFCDLTDPPPEHYSKDKRCRAKHRAWVTKNRDKCRAAVSKYQAKRIKTDPLFKLTKRLRGRIYDAVKGGYKAGSAIKALGCSIEDFKIHIENQFISGMTWENWGEWHLDHIKPLAKFNLANKQDFYEVCHWTNYQPLWAADNIKKGAK